MAECRSGINYEEREVDLTPNHGKWKIFTCYSENEARPCDIDLQRNPLVRFGNSCAKNIMSRLKLDTGEWLGSEALGSMRISSDFHVTNDVRASSTKLDETNCLCLIEACI